MLTQKLKHIVFTKVVIFSSFIFSNNIYSMDNLVQEIQSERSNTVFLEIKCNGRKTYTFLANSGKSEIGQFNKSDRSFELNHNLGILHIKGSLQYAMDENLIPECNEFNQFSTNKEFHDYVLKNFKIRRFSNNPPKIKLKAAGMNLTNLFIPSLINKKNELKKLIPFLAKNNYSITETPHTKKVKGVSDNNFQDWLDNDFSFNTEEDENVLLKTNMARLTEYLSDEPQKVKPGQKSLFEDDRSKDVYTLIVGTGLLSKEDVSSLSMVSKIMSSRMEKLPQSIKDNIKSKQAKEN